MLEQGAVGRKTFLAMFARKRSLVGVHSLVNRQQRLTMKRFRALAAFVSLRTSGRFGVAAKVLVQIVFARKGFT